MAIDPHENWAAKSMLKESGFETTDISIPILTDPTLTVSATYGVAFGMRVHVEVSDRPATFIIDKQGVLRYARLAEKYDDRPDANEIIRRVKALGE